MLDKRDRELCSLEVCTRESRRDMHTMCYLLVDKVSFFLCSHLSPSLFPHMSTVVSQHAPTSSLFVPSHLSSLFRENPSRILAIVSNTVQCCCDIMFGMDHCRLPHWQYLCSSRDIWCGDLCRVWSPYTWNYLFCIETTCLLCRSNSDGCLNSTSTAGQAAWKRF